MHAIFLRHTTLGAALAGLTALTACSSSDKGSALSHPSNDGGDGGGTPSVGLSAAAIQDLEAKGVNKYLGKYKPVNQPSEDGGMSTFDFGTATDGPICIWGDEFSVTVRDQHSDNLVIYLQGGGACWTGFCGVTTPTVIPGIPNSGILKPDPDNVVGSWNVVYVPYCDGSVFSGDNDVSDPNAQNAAKMRYHHGVKNLSAALDVAKAQFPDPKRIALVGSSAGGYGTIIGTALVRFEYPHTPLIVFNDAGLGLSPPDPTITTIKNDWKFDQFIPDSCTECKGGTNDTALIGWGLKNDPSLRAAAFSSYADAIIDGTFLKIPQADFKTLLLDQTGAIHTAFPDRFERFFVNGSEHTTLILDTGNGSLGGYQDVFDGIKIADWTKAFVNDTADWVDHLQP
jgi:hypothetical protein